MKDLRDIKTPPEDIFVIDDWISLAESNHMVWAFEYDGSAVLWGDVKQGNNHFPRKITMWLDDTSSQATSYLFYIRDRIGEDLGKKYKSNHMFPTDTYLDAVVDSSLSGVNGSWWQYYRSILFLNDNYVGGEIEFPEHDFMVTPRMGSLLMYPAKEEVTTAATQGTAYRMVSCYTDHPEFRESDTTFSKRPFTVQGIHPKTTGKKKKKGCGGCAEARKKVKIKVRNKKTGEVTYVEKSKKEWAQMKRNPPGKKKGIII